MFIHNFKYTMKTLLRDKMLIFWTFAFPLILGTFFSMAFSNIEENEKLNIIDLAVVKNEKLENSKIFHKAIVNLSDKENESRLFNTQYVTEEKAKKLLSEEKITGYIVLEETPKVVVMTNGINETIIKQVTEEIIEKEEIIQKVGASKLSSYLSQNEKIHNVEQWYAKVYEDVLTSLEQKPKIKNISNSHLSYTMIEFYTLIAMTCLYGGVLGMVSMNKCLANMSSKGKRVAVSKTPKHTLVLSSALASYVIELIGVILLFLYTIFILKVDYGSKLPSIVLLALVGCLAGLSLGLFIATLLKSSENVKTGIIIAITMLGCFLSGMMGITMKYIIDKNIPLLNKINPASMITDGLYSLYYYSTMNRFYFNLGSLFLFSFVMIMISMFSLRRQKYDSI